MANVNRFNPSQALITPGWPTAQVPMANPHATVQLKEGTATTPAISTATKTSLTQSGHTTDRID